MADPPPPLPPPPHMSMKPNSPSKSPSSPARQLSPSPPPPPPPPPPLDLSRKPNSPSKGHSSPARPLSPSPPPPPPPRDLSRKPNSPSKGPSSPTGQLSLSPQDPILTTAPLLPHGAYAKPRRMRPYRPPRAPTSPRSTLPEIRLVPPPPRQPSPPPAWVILDVESWERELHEYDYARDEDFAADLLEPPDISRIFAKRIPYPSGFIMSRVLSADPRSALLVATVFRGRDGPRFLRLMGFQYDKRLWNSKLDDSPPNLIQKDVPDRDSALIPEERLGNIGMITLSGGPDNDYMIAELEMKEGCDVAKLFTVRGHKSADWCAKEIVCPMSHRPWGKHGVISHNSRLWWIDLSQGLLSCDPSADEPELTFEPLPSDITLEATVSEDIRSYRYIGVSDENLCYLEISPEHEAVLVWIHDDKSSGWKHHVTVNFREIWENETYHTADLPKILPAVALIHPPEPNLVYFMFKDLLFGVDLMTKRTSCVACKDKTSSILLPWIMPTVGCPSDTSDLRDEALKLLKVVKDVPSCLKKKLSYIVRLSKIMEDCMNHIYDNLEKWPMESFIEEEICENDLFTDEGEQLSSLSTAEQESSNPPGKSSTAEEEKIQSILNRIVASIVADLEGFCEVIHCKILMTELKNLDYQTDQIRLYYLGETLEDIGEAEATKILNSGAELKFLKDSKDHSNYLFDLLHYTSEIAEMMSNWADQHHELVRKWIQAASRCNRDDPKDGE